LKLAIFGHSIALGAIASLTGKDQVPNAVFQHKGPRDDVFQHPGERRSFRSRSTGLTVAKGTSCIAAVFFQAEARQSFRKAAVQS
jgi:hypothetical protein